MTGATSSDDTLIELVSRLEQSFVNKDDSESKVMYYVWAIMSVAFVALILFHAMTSNSPVVEYYADLKRELSRLQGYEKSLIDKLQSAENRLAKLAEDNRRFEQGLASIERQQHEISSRGGVRLGMMIPYLGKELPLGYRECDGRGRFPQAEWVPSRLKGTPLPDMKGAGFEVNLPGQGFVPTRWIIRVE